MTRLLFLISFLTGAFFAQGQSFFVGGGVNGFFINNPIDDASSFMRRGYQIGGDVSLGEVFYLRTGTYFTATQSNVDFSVDNEEVSGRFRASHLRIPVKGGLRFYDKDHLSIFVETGITSMIRLGVGGSETIGEDLSFLEDEYRAHHWGWVIGGGIRINFIEISLYYDAGLTRAFDADGSENSRFGLLQLNMGFNF